jgi:alkanesulfonate monooxygenase SsuD/methylene tetrahydromethanopterin reductase-like flavin-dependent oxidoreductase (luciferase family)
MSDDRQQLARWRTESSPVPRIIGTAAEIAETMKQYIEIGLDEFVVSDHTMGRDTNEKRDNMDRFLDEVVLGLEQPSGS